MYLGIFGINIVFRRCTYVLLVVAALWGISTGLVAIFQCHPIAAAYDMKLQQMKGTKCIHLTQYLVSTSILNVVVDAVILVLPLRILWTLQLRTSRKVSLSFVFLLGILYVTSAITVDCYCYILTATLQYDRDQYSTYYRHIYVDHHRSHLGLGSARNVLIVGNRLWNHLRMLTCHGASSAKALWSSYIWQK